MPEPSRSKSAPLVWVTRTRPGADRTAARLRALGFEPIVQPLLEARPVEDAVIDLAGVGALAFTSAHAVAAFAKLSPERSAPVLAVGDATAAAAKAAGFVTVLSAGGDVKALAALIGARPGDIAGSILYASAAQPSRDLSAELEPLGVPVRRVTVYETTEAEPPSALLQRLPDLDAVLLHSARGARALARLLTIHPAPHLLAVCLSQQVAAPLDAACLAAIACATAPHEAALIEALRLRKARA
jgi:uroporphyrinogen-III synthase